MPTYDANSLQHLVRTWIAYDQWAAQQEPTSQVKQDAQDAEAERNGFWAWEAVEDLVRREPEHAWAAIVELVRHAPDDSVLASIAAGPLEDLLCHHPYAMIDRVEQLALEDTKFRRCVAGVWGWSRLPEGLQARIRRAAQGTMS